MSDNNTPKQETVAERYSRVAAEVRGDKYLHPLVTFALVAGGGLLASMALTAAAQALIDNNK